MSYQFDSLLNQAKPIAALTDADEFRRLVQRMLDNDVPRIRRRWNYYRNPLTVTTARADGTSSDRPYRQAQEWGLPARITGVTNNANGTSTSSLDGVSRKEVVVENDIAWRIETLVDYLFGRPVTIGSAAPDAKRRDLIEKLLRAIFARHGGIVLLQQIALLGAVYGFVDVLVKFDASAAAEVSSDSLIDLFTANLSTANRSGANLSTDRAGLSERTATPTTTSAASESVPPDAEPAPRADDATNAEDAQEANLARLARCIRFEIVDPARALPLLDPNDYRNAQAYAQVYQIARPSIARSKSSEVRKHWLETLFPRFVTSARALTSSESVDVIELITAHRWQRYEDETLVAEGNNSLGELPLVHIQNAAVPFEYAGSSDVESLIPLQDELNTRLSDRAHRITMQSFKMYLGKGIENFGDMPVAPGRMWMTDNDNAQVIEFGGDASSPSEDSHIKEIREAMDKTSSVTPIAAGAIKGRIGRLTSAAALRVTLLALLAKTDRKRSLYGEGIGRMCALALAWFDRAGILKTTESERRIQLAWPSPIPIDDGERLADAEAKLRIGVSREVVLRELGY